MTAHRLSTPALAALCLSLGACAATPASPPIAAGPGEVRNPAPAPAQGADALAPQALSPGACGLFFFEVRAPNRFVLFENETERVVRLIESGPSDPGLVELGVPAQAAAMVPGAEFRRVYLDGARNVTYTLTGSVGEETGSGQRLEDVILRVRRLDGTQTVTPLAGVRRCMERQPAAPR